MSATKVMVSAMLLGVVGRWANNKKALPDAKGLVEILFALGLITFLDNGKTEPVAKGFAWLFFAAVLLSPDSPLTGLARIKAGSTGSAVAVSAGNAAAAAGKSVSRTPTTGGAMNTI